MLYISLRLKVLLITTLFLVTTLLIVDVNFKENLISITFILLAQWTIIFYIFSPLQNLYHSLRKFNQKEIIQLSSENYKDDEVGLIKKTIYSISSQNEDYIKNLALLNTQLEDKIYQRTQELLVKNKHLQKEIISRKEKERLLIQQSKMAAMGEMISAISHQWKQPLNMLALQLQDVYFKSQLGQLTPEHMVDANEKANSLIQFMSHTIDDFRNFFTPEKKYELFDIRTAIDETLFLVQSILKNNNIDVHISGTNMQVSGLQNEFKQVILNLFSNAKDAIVAQRKKNKAHIAQIDIQIKDEGSFYCIHFIDTGGGIKKKLLDKIYEPYFTTKEEDKGTGIGLYMSKLIIEENMHGKIDVNILSAKESPLKTRGTEFILQLAKDK